MKLTTRAGGVVLLGGLLAGAPGVAVAEDAASAVAVAAPTEATSATVAVAATEATDPDPAARSPQHDLLVQAIAEKRVLHFTYAGHPRVVEPYAYGVSATGEAVLHGYQIAGGSTSKPPPGWRTFAVSGISDVIGTERRFAKTRADYSAERPKLDPQWAEVAGAVKTEEAATE